MCWFPNQGIIKCLKLSAEHRTYIYIYNVYLHWSIKAEKNKDLKSCPAQGSTNLDVDITLKTFNLHCKLTKEAEKSAAWKTHTSSATKIPAFCETISFTSVFTKFRHFHLSWATSIQSASSHHKRIFRVSFSIIIPSTSRCSKSLFPSAPTLHDKPPSIYLLSVPAMCHIPISPSLPTSAE